jgi:hypothetical protein
MFLALLVLWFYKYSNLDDYYRDLVVKGEVKLTHSLNIRPLVLNFSNFNDTSKLFKPKKVYNSNSINLSILPLNILQKLLISFIIILFLNLGQLIHINGLNFLKEIIVPPLQGNKHLLNTDFDYLPLLVSHFIFEQKL